MLGKFLSTLMVYDYLFSALAQNGGTEVEGNCTSKVLPDRELGGRRQKTLLICNPPLPLTQVFTQTSFHSFQQFLPVQLKGVHFKH